MKTNNPANQKYPERLLANRRATSGVKINHKRLSENNPPVLETEGATIKK